MATQVLNNGIAYALTNSELIIGGIPFFGKFDVSWSGGEKTWEPGLGAQGYVSRYGLKFSPLKGQVTLEFEDFNKLQSKASDGRISTLSPVEIKLVFSAAGQTPLVYRFAQVMISDPEIKFTNNTAMTDVTVDFFFSNLYVNGKSII